MNNAPRPVAEVLDNPDGVTLLAVARVGDSGIDGLLAFVKQMINEASGPPVESSIIEVDGSKYEVTLRGSFDFERKVGSHYIATRIYCSVTNAAGQLLGWVGVDTPEFHAYFLPLDRKTWQDHSAIYCGSGHTNPVRVVRRLLAYNRLHMVIPETVESIRQLTAGLTEEENRRCQADFFLPAIVHQINQERKLAEGVATVEDDDDDYADDADYEDDNNENSRDNPG